MKTNQSYLLEKDLDLENENFIVKKGTLVHIVNLYDKNDKKAPTVVGIKFGNINGTYHLGEDLVKNLVKSGSMTAVARRFNVGDCVLTPDGEGKVKSHFLDPLLSWLYGVNLNEGDAFIYKESELDNCK
ncbi:hypothetical protein D3C87_364780 [compost metagenome]